jgi:hypothetical protein
MKLLISFILFNLFFTKLYAGGSGGGVGPRPEERTVVDLARIKTDPTIRIIHGTPSLNGVSRISVGRINQNQWQVQQIDIPDDLLIKTDLSQEIQKSIELNDWVEIKN